MIVTLDGMDAVGKSTVANLLKEELNASIIKGVRDIYVDKLAYDSPSIEVRHLYYLASFLDSILNAKANIHSIIIFDKSFYSTIAYHKCLGSQIDIEKTITSIVNPDVKIFLTCPKEIWLKRLKERKKIDWYEEQIIIQKDLSEKIESAYSEMGLIRIVNDNLENTVLEILNLLTHTNHMSVEIIPIFDDNFEIIGQSDYETVHSKGIWHQVVHCWIIDSDSFSIVYQKRNKTKAIYPDMLDVSVAGHCRINESPVEAVCREAFEELGIKIEPHKLLKIGVRRDAFSSKYKINREFQHIFLYKTSITPNNIKIEKNEIQYIVLLKPDDVLKAIEENQNIFGKKILDDLASEIEISFSEFIPSIDNYNIKIPITTGKYLNGEKKIYF